jgi:deoxycytidylate deaminase
MSLAHLAAQRSTCDRLKPFPGVGAVVVREDAIMSTGYSGAPRGVGQCDDRVCSNCAARFDMTTHSKRSKRFSGKITVDEAVDFLTTLRDRPFIYSSVALELGATCPSCNDGVLGHGHKLIKRYNEAGTFSEHCILTVHAETNAIVEAGRQRTIGGTLYTTHLPCWDCAKLIVNSGVKRVVFEQPYQLLDSIDLLRANLADGLFRLDPKTEQLTDKLF